MMIDPTTHLIVTIGLPRSGKSTWAKKVAMKEGYPIVNPDSIRLAIHGQDFIGDAEPFVWATAQAMTKALFYAGHRGVIIDATNTTEKRRQMWRMIHPNITWVFFTTPVNVCFQRAQEHPNPDLSAVVMRMHKSMEPIRDTDKAIFVDFLGQRLEDQPEWRKSV